MRNSAVISGIDSIKLSEDIAHRDDNFDFLSSTSRHSKLDSVSIGREVGLLSGSSTRRRDPTLRYIKKVIEPDIRAVTSQNKTRVPILKEMATLAVEKSGQQADMSQKNGEAPGHFGGPASINPLDSHKAPGAPNSLK